MTRTVPIADLTPDPENANTHPRRNLEAIKASLVEFGQVKPLVITPDMVVRAGSGTLTAALDLGWTHIAVAEFAGTPEQARAYAIADNRTAELAVWDDRVLLAQLDSLGADLQLAAGFDHVEIDSLMDVVSKLDKDSGRFGEPGAPVVDDSPPGDSPRYAERIKHPRTQGGDVWHLGPHRVICGDSFRAETLDRVLPGGGRVDAMLTAPPYAIYGSSTGIGADIADDRMVRPFFEAVCRLIVGRVKLFGHAYVHCDWRSWAALVDGARVAGLPVKNMIVWDKQSQGMGNMYAHTFEIVAFLVPEPPPRAMSSGRKTGHRVVLKSNLVRYPRVSGTEREHNAAKPVQMLADFLANSTDEGDVVLDAFGGSGSTLIACETTGRVCYTVDQDPRWCDVIAARWQRLTGKLPELHRDGARPRMIDLTEVLVDAEPEAAKT